MIKIIQYWVEADNHDDLLRKAIDRSPEIWKYDRNDVQYDYIYIEHDDRSRFKIHYVYYKWGKVGDLKYLVIYPEHNPVGVYCMDDITYAHAKTYDEYCITLKNKTELEI